MTAEEMDQFEDDMNKSYHGSSDDFLSLQNAAARSSKKKVIIRLIFIRNYFLETGEHSRAAQVDMILGDFNNATRGVL